MKGDMKCGVSTVTVLCLLSAAGPAAAQDLKEIACGRNLEKAGAPPQMVLDPALHVLDQAKAIGKFDPGTPPPGYAIKSIFCARSDIVPAPSDYKVVQAGYPLMIFARDNSKPGGPTRIAILEMDNGQLRLRSVGQAGFTPEMTSRIQRFLDASLPEFGKTAAATNPTH
jgi:hypothetical protein